MDRCFLQTFRFWPQPSIGVHCIIQSLRIDAHVSKTVVLDCVTSTTSYCHSWPDFRQPNRIPFFSVRSPLCRHPASCSSAPCSLSCELRSIPCKSTLIGTAQPEYLCGKSMRPWNPQAYRYGTQILLWPVVESDLDFCFTAGDIFGSLESFLLARCVILAMLRLQHQYGL